MPLVILRVVAVLALVLLLWNPASSRTLSPSDQPIVLLDASLSMRGDQWRAALDSARALARRRGALVWRFGSRVTPLDTTSPSDGATRLGPALEAAAARAGEVIVVTDGAVDDAATIPPDLKRRPRVVLASRPPFYDAYVASVEGVRHVTRGDTVRLRVSYGTAGKREGGSGKGTARLVVSVGNRRLATQPVTLPDSGLLVSSITLPASLFPLPGWQVIQVALDGVDDAEPRDDSRLFAVDVSLQPAAVILASPPDWELRFLARTLTDVARLPVKTYVETELGHWRDAGTLAPASTADVGRTVEGARLVILAGEPERARPMVGAAPRGAAQLRWFTGGQAGDWYVERPAPSVLASALGGVVWDSLPPATAVIPARDTGEGIMVVLTARLARRGAARPIVTLDARDAQRRATVGAAGLWRWAFRGGAAEEAYRSLVAALVDWLLGERGAGSRERAVPVAMEAANGLPLAWRWESGDEPRPIAITLEDEHGTRSDTLRFDAAGRAELLLPPGVYRYALGGGPERGVVAVETYSDEWRPHAPSLEAQNGEPTARMATVGLRDRWWLFVVAIAAFAAEWALRRRQGLP